MKWRDNESDLCSDCRKKVRAAFEKDEFGKLQLVGSPEVCDMCKEAMKDKMQSNRGLD